jgi:hypothetical protein
LLASRVAPHWADNAPLPTYEGVNVVMFQQSSRMLLKNMKKIGQGKNPKGIFSYLNKLDELVCSK